MLKNYLLLLLAFLTTTINSATLKNKNYVIYIGSDEIGRMFFKNHLNAHQKKLLFRASKAEYRLRTAPSKRLIKRQLKDELSAKEEIFLKSIRSGYAKKSCTYVSAAYKH